ncbi:radical SAM protein [Streptomyces sp. NPDC020875]|uniref:radical SAM protein n=1 Tax=Streptomyces sp. NPDC020875 TaxID=3154898 RepID=UPI0033E69BDC
MTIAPEAPAPLRFLSLEITGRCQFTCPSHCYAQAGPGRTHGSMNKADWCRVLEEAVLLGARTVQLIGGEPTLHPDFGDLVAHALGLGLNIRVYSNSYRVRERHWAVLARPRVSLATTVYSDDPTEHDAITGRPGSHAATVGNVAEALRRGVDVSVTVVDLGGGQRAEQARTAMLALGVGGVHLDRVRAVGNAARGNVTPFSALCGRCGIGKAAILPDGSVAVCEIGRSLTGGSVAAGASLADVLASARWAEVTARIPRRPGADPCAPDCAPTNDTCGPAKGDTCGPAEDE